MRAGRRPLEADRQLLVQPQLHGAAACLGQHLRFAEWILHRGARAKLGRGHFVTHDDALNSEIDQRTEVIWLDRGVGSHVRVPTILSINFE